VWLLLIGAENGQQTLLKMSVKNNINTVLEITVDHWPFSNQFQHLADQNLFWSANFTVHFQWDGNQ